MRSTRIARFVWILALAPLVAPPSLAADAYTIDSTHSTVWFSINHLGVSTFHGRFNDLSGSFAFDAANPAACSFEVTIKADSVDTHNERRDQHLNSPDFLNSKQFPTITMKSKSVKKSGDKGFRVTADLTLHGVTKEIEIDVTLVGTGKDPRGTERSGFDAKFTIQRSDFDIKFMPGGLGEAVTLTVGIEGVRS